jgi:hypothetical protein
MQQSNSEENLVPSKASKAKTMLRRFWRRIENTVFGLVLLFISLYFVLQSTAVQNWLISHITHYMSEELHTRVEIKHVDIEFFDNLVLEGLYIQDLQGDTLIYAGKFSAGLNSNIFSLLWGNLEFNEITLSQARINIVRPEGFRHNNLQFILDYFSGASTKPKSKPTPFSVKIKNFKLNDVAFLSFDHVNGRKLLFKIPYGNIKVNNLDLGAGIVDIRSVELRNFLFDFEDYPSVELPPDPQMVSTPIAEEEDQAPRNPTKPLQCSVGMFSITDGRFEMDKFHISPAKETLQDVMDYNHLLVQDINIQADSIKFTDDLDFTGVLQSLSAREQCGFAVSQSKAAKVVVNDTITALYQANIQSSNGTSLGDTVMLHYKTYRDYLHFNGNVRMDIRMSKGSKVALGDIMHFNSTVNENEFFIKNRALLADITGQVEGKVNRLNGRNLDIRIGSGTVIQGDFDGNDMNEGTDRLQLHFKFNHLQSDIETIGRIIPGFNPPKAIYRLGHIGYKGEYDILFGYDHIFNGDLITDIGSGKLDLKMNLSNGVDNAAYSGSLDMKNFDLASWTGNSDFGKTTFHVAIDEGSSGLTMANIKAKVKGVIDTFYYKGYNYRKVEMNGAFQEKVFDGKLSVKDPNIDFVFDGNIDFKDTIPQMAFSADVGRLDLGALHLMNEDWIVSGKLSRISLSAHNWNDLNGTVSMRDFQILQDHEVIHRIDSVQLSSFTDALGNTRFNVKSSIMDGYLKGRFQLTQVVHNLMQGFSRFHPDFAKLLKLAPYDSVALTDKYQMEVHIKDTKTLTGLLNEDLAPFNNYVITADVDMMAGKTLLDVSIPMFRYQNITSRNILFHWDGIAENGSYNFSIPSSTIGEDRKLPPINLYGWLKRDALGLKLTARDTSRQSYFLKGINLDGVLSVVDSLWQLKFNSSELAMFNEEWLISDANYVRFGNNFLAAKEFEFFSGNKRILVDSLNYGHGISLSMTNFDLNTLNRFLDPDMISMRGKLYDFDITVQDIFKLQKISGFISTDTVFVNNVPYGDVTGNFDMEDLASPLSWKVFVQYQEQKLRVAGAWLPSGEQPVYVRDVDLTVAPGEFVSQVNAHDFPLQVIETFIPDISKTAGRFDADVKVGGKFNRIGANGLVTITEGQFQMDYLKTMYHIKNQPVSLSEYKIWADGDTIWDASQKSMAFIRGGLKHDHFSNWVLDCSIKSRKGDNFMILNTLPEDNSMYYGQGLGQFEAVFSGTFSRTNILVTATTGKDTRLYIPLSTAEDVTDVNFIKFVKKSSENQDSINIKSNGSSIGELKGLNFEMNVTMTDAAEVQLIFDEQAGDIIKGRGEGNIKLVINREGEFKMYGNYQIRRGEYLFTLLNWINKPFTVAEGGTIIWYGDPYGAQIALDATYEENTPVYNLIQEEIQIGGGAQQDELEKDARKATKTIVTMHLKGDLLKPSIGFDLEFPNATGNLKTFIDNKLRLLHLDQNELNRQVFGLVVVGSFLPSSSSSFLQNTDYVASAFNTLTQVLTNQFSGYLSGLAAEWFGGKVSSIDFDIAYNEYRNALNDPGAANVGRELQVRLSSGFANDRITIQVGSQFGLGSPGVSTTSGFLGEDVVVEIQLTENKQWKLKVYQRTEPDIILGQQRGRYGLGLTFRKEFDTFSELITNANKELKKK